MASTTTTSHHHHHHHHHYGGGGGGGNGSNNGHYYPNNANSNHHHSHFAHHVRTKAWGIQPGWKFVASESSTVRKPPNYIAESPAAGSTAPAAAVTSKDRFQYFENGIGRIHPPSSSSAAAASSYLASLDARKPASSYSTSLSPRSQPKHYEISPISSDLSPRSRLNGFEPTAPPRPRRSLHPPLTSVSSTGSSSGSSSASSSSNKDDSNDGSGSEEKADYINHHRLRNSSLSRSVPFLFASALFTFTGTCMYMYRAPRLSDPPYY